MIGKKINEIGNKYGRLTVIQEKGVDKYRNVLWLCKCDCGKEKIINGKNLRKGQTRSCGCLQRDIVSIPKGEASFNAIFYAMEKNAKQRNHKWMLSREQVKNLTKQNCYYCGIGPKQGFNGYSKHANGIYSYNGLDRVDNTQGYSINNVVACCGRCNKAKNTMAQKVFFEWIETVYFIHKKKENLKMKVTGIKFYPLRNPKGKTVAMLSFILQDAITFHGCTWVNGDKGYFIGMPSRKDKDNKWVPQIVFNKKELLAQITKAVNEEFESSGLAEKLNGSGNKPTVQKSDEDDGDLFGDDE